MRLGTAALTLAVGLGFVGMASGQEPGNWFTRLMPFGGEKADSAKKLDSKSEPANMPPTSTDYRALKAKADLERRRDICDKLRGIGIASGDDDLVRKAEMLDQRAWDLYVACTNRGRTSSPSVVEADAKKGDRK